MTDSPPEERTATLPATADGAWLDGFATLGLDQRLLSTLAALGYEEPTPIQREAIPPLLRGRDLLAEAPTGTGKTAAFALPILHRLGSRSRPAAHADGQVAVLVLVPTRELAMQVAEAMHRYGERLGLRVLPVYGGQAIGLQLRSLRRGVDIVVATPGRAVDHVERKSLRLDGVEFVVLDEADEMLDMGFADDLERLLTETPTTRQTALFSATISTSIARIAQRHLRDPERVTIARAEGPSDGLERVRQVAYVVRRADKLTALCRILDLEDPRSVLVFARTRGEVDELADRLSGRGREAGALHGGLSQEQRDRVLGRFRERDLEVLVATDVAARGLDIEDVTHVINYDVPSNPDAYIHRIGRTGRAGREGVAITLVEPREHRLLRNIERSARTSLTLGRIPTVADLRERRMELLRAELREMLLEDGHERFRTVVESLADEFDVVDVALAAVSLAERSSRGGTDEQDEIVPVSLAEGPEAGSAPRRGGVPRKREREAMAPRTSRARGRSAEGGWARLFVGGGRRMGLRPGDLVGAIAGETGLPASSIGAIHITDAYALVDIPEADVDQVVHSLRAAKIRGRSLTVRRERER